MEGQDLEPISLIAYIIAILIGLTVATVTALAVIHMIGGY